MAIGTEDAAHFNSEDFDETCRWIDYEYGIYLQAAQSNNEFIRKKAEGEFNTLMQEVVGAGRSVHWKRTVIGVTNNSVEAAGYYDKQRVEVSLILCQDSYPFDRAEEIIAKPQLTVDEVLHNLDIIRLKVDKLKFDFLALIIACVMLAMPLYYGRSQNTQGRRLGCDIRGGSSNCYLQG